MIISRTPLRISFTGGGSDLSAYYHHAKGAVVTTAINKYIYITVNESFNDQIIVRYSKEERVNRVEELEHNLIREALKLLKITHGIDISSTADVPSEGSGLGSSSSYLVGVLHALHAYKGEHVSAERLAREACHIEIEKLGKPIGKQDQYIAAYGGFNYIQFNADESVFVDPIIFPSKTKKRLEKKLLLLYTGITRSSSKILSKQKKNLIHDTEKRRMMSKIVGLADEMRQNLRRNNLHSAGELLDKNWNLKKRLADTITSPQIDRWYKIAQNHGAIGGKILGAGGGGFMLLYAPENKHRAIVRALPDLRVMKISFEQQGSKIIFVSD